MILSTAWIGASRRAFSATTAVAMYCTPLHNKGHSKWQNIKATKGKNDLLKSQAANQLLRKVKSAVNRGGFDMKLNRELAQLEQEFKSAGLSLDTFRNYLSRLKDRPEVECAFDVIGPSGTFFIVVAETDNKKNFESTLRKYFNKVGGFRMATDSSAVRSWFNEKGVLLLGIKKDTKEIKLDQMEEIGIEMDCEEVLLVEEDGLKKFEVICDSKKVQSVENEFVKQGFCVESAEVEYRPMHPIQIQGDDANKVEKFYELVQEDESVKQIYDNIDPSSLQATV